MAFYIYGLVDPDTEEVRYVGQTENPKKRYRQHCGPETRLKTKKAEWIRGLISRGLKPSMIILEEVVAGRVSDCEAKWIRHYRSIGRELVNADEWGPGARKNTVNKSSISIKVSTKRKVLALAQERGVQNYDIIERAIDLFISVHVPQELRDRLDTLLDKNPGASEAEIVRQALDKFLPKSRERVK